MSGTFTNWPRIVDRALEVERLPSLAVLTAGAPPRSSEQRLTRSDADEIWALVDELPLARPFGITMARVVDYADFEELGLALAATTSVCAVVELLERYQRLLSDAMTVEAHDEGATVSLTIATHGAAHWSGVTHRRG